MCVIVKRTVDGDTDDITDLFNLAASQTNRSQVPEDEMVIGSLGLKSVVVLAKLVGKYPRILDNLLRVLLEGGLGGEIKGGSNGSDGLEEV